MKLIDKISYLLMAWLILSACQKDFKDVSWETEIIAPLITGEMSIENLVKTDTTFVQNGKDLSFVYKQDIHPILLNLDTIIEIGTKPFEKTIKLQTLELASQEFNNQITLGDIISSLPTPIADGTAIPSFFLGAGINVPPLPAQSIDFSNFITSAVLTKGDLNIEIENQLPLDLAEIRITIRNSSSGILLFQKTYNNIKSRKTSSFTEDLAQELNGQAIEGKLDITIDNVHLTLPTGFVGNILINYADFLRFKVGISNIKVSSATAIFPAQDVVDFQDTTRLTDVGDVELLWTDIDKGTVKVSAYSTIPTKMFFTYKIISAIKNGQTFVVDTILPAAPGNGTADSVVANFYFNEYHLDLTGDPLGLGNGSLFNTFFSSLVGHIDSTGQQISMSLQDSIFILIQVTKIKPQNIKGYAGQDTFSITEGVHFEGLDQFSADEIKFKNVNFKLTIENGFVIPAQLHVKTLTAYNTKKGTQASVSGITHPILPALENNKIITPVTTEIEIPNTAALISIQPDSLVYDFEIITNPNGNTPPYSNFAQKITAITPKAIIEIPLEMNVKGFYLSDTADFAINQIDIPDILKNEKIYLLLDNSIPASGNLNIIFMNDNYDIIDSLSTSKSFLSPAVDVNGVSVETARSSYVFDMPKARLHKILNAAHIKYDVKFNTSDMIEYVKIQSDNTIKITLVGDVGLIVNKDLIK